MTGKDIFILCQLCLLDFVAITSGFPNISILNATGPFIFDANKSSEVLFSVEGIGEETLTIFISHKFPGATISRLKCYLTNTPGHCSSSSEDCECLDEKPGHHYRLKKVFLKEDNGDWTFKISGKGVSQSKSIKITVVSHFLQATESVNSSTAETVQASTPPPSPAMKGLSDDASKELSMASKAGSVTEMSSHQPDNDATCSKGCDRIFLIVVITCVVVVVVVCAACVLLIISVRYFLNRFAWEHRHCLLSTRRVGLRTESLSELLPDHLQAETSFSRGKYYAYRRKRTRSTALDDGGDEISYMCIDDDNAHGAYLTPLADSLNDNAAG